MYRGAGAFTQVLRPSYRACEPVSGAGSFIEKPLQRDGLLSAIESAPEQLALPQVGNNTGKSVRIARLPAKIPQKVLLQADFSRKSSSFRY